MYLSKRRSWGRQFTLIFLAGLITAGCETTGAPEGQIGHVTGNFGGVVSDEPRSALIGRDILSSGGNAVDAMVSVYFALSVTYPLAGTLGGGGQCVVHRGGEGSLDAIDFRPAIVERDGRRIAVPGGVRGLFALHARHGRLPWARLLLPAERIARFGFPVSRAFATRLAAASPAEVADPAFRKAFSVDGKLLREGDVLRQVELAASLARIRLRGPGEFYTGELAKRVAEGLGAAAGLTVSVDDIRNYRPRWLETVSAKVGNHELRFAADETGRAAQALWRKRAEGGRILPPAPPDRPTSSNAGVVAIDREGGVAACVFSASGVVGAGRMIANTGILASAAPEKSRPSGLPAIIVNRPRKDAYGAVSAVGGPDGDIEAMLTAFEVFRRKAEPGATLARLPKVSNARINVIHCPEGILGEADICRFAADPRGHGLAVSAAF